MARCIPSWFGSQALIVLSIFSSLTAAGPPPGWNPFADPANDPYNPLHYIPNNGLTAMAVSEFFAFL